MKQTNDKTGDSLEAARRYAAFDLLVAGRAELNENAVSADPRARIGGETPAVWRKRLGDADADARATGFEGKLALKLKRLGAEIVSERGAGEKIEAELGVYAKFIPKLFGGQMGREVERGKTDVAAYEKEEVQ